MRAPLGPTSAVYALPLAAVLCLTAPAAAQQTPPPAQLADVRAVPGKLTLGDKDGPGKNVLLLGGVKAGAGAGEPPPAAPISGPLRASKNPNYFEDATGKPLILCGSHSWNTLQDWGTDGAVRPLDFEAFVGFLKAHGHNFTLLWYTELPKFRGLPSTEKSPPDFTVGPHPWMRTGPGNATDGGLKFDLTKFNPE